jgi:hypothetical protein
MLSRKLIVSTCAAAMLTGVNVANALAQDVVDARTEFTFKAPVELPGTTLPPGTYVFRFADPNTGRKVMQVLDKASNKTYGLFLTISAQRPKAADDAELRFMETPAGKPAAVKTWWYPGNSTGREFIYPKEQARRLAIATNTTVLTTKADNVPAAQMPTTDLAYVSPSGQETAAIEKTVAEVNNAAPTGDDKRVSVDLDRTPVQQSQRASNAPGRRSLPHTNGLLPLLALMGVTSLASGTSLRFRR